MCWDAATHRLTGVSSMTKYGTWRATVCSSCPTSSGARARGPCNRCSPSTTSENFGGHMSRAAQHFVDRWPAGGDVDLDVECRRIAMQSLGRSVLGIDLNERADTIANCMHVASSYTADRALRPVRAPRWMPTLARRRARAAVIAMRTITDEMVRACRADPTRDAPLVQALLAASDPRNRAADLGRRHLQRPADLHARRPRHHRDGAHLLTVGPRPPSATSRIAWPPRRPRSAIGS